MIENWLTGTDGQRARRVGSDETVSLSREVDLKQIAAINAPRSNNGVRSWWHSSSTGFTANFLGAPCPECGHRNGLLPIGLFPNDQFLKRSHLCTRRLHAVRTRDRISRRNGV